MVICLKQKKITYLLDDKKYSSPKKKNLKLKQNTLLLHFVIVTFIILFIKNKQQSEILTATNMGHGLSLLRATVGSCATSGILEASSAGSWTSFLAYMQWLSALIENLQLLHCYKTRLNFTFIECLKKT